MTESGETGRTEPTPLVLRDRSGRVRLDVSGPDRQKFLHNLTTQDVKHLPAGEGREAFVTSPQGKTLGYVTLLAAGDRILVRSDREGWGPVLPHLAKYGVFDEVTLDDVSDRTFELHLASAGAGDRLAAAGLELPPAGDLRHGVGQVGGVEVLVVRESLTGRPGFTLIGEKTGLDAVSEALRQAVSPHELIALDDAAFEALRIEAGVPVAGRDVTPDNLPQEVARDALAINFVKGCYLGQETVARIDALGHVNRLLRGLRLDATVPPPPGAAILQADGRAIGAVTSAARASGGSCVVALGYVRNSHARAGTPVQVLCVVEGQPEQRIPAIVCDLPMGPW